MTTPFWLDEPYEPRPPLSGDVEVDACVIGAGVAGLSCARALAQRGAETIVLERDTVAGGERPQRRLPPGWAGGVLRGRPRAELYARTLAAQEEIYALAAELGVADAVRRTGLLRVSASDDEAEHVRRQAEALQADGFPAELVEREQLPEALQAAFHNACLTPDDGALHPARWIKALARAAEGEGARIARARRSARRSTAAGGRRRRQRSRAPCGGRRRRRPAGARPRARSRVRARRLHMVATEPLSERLVDCPVYARWGFEYFQQPPDGRLLAGGFSDLDGDGSYTDRYEGNPAVWERIERYLAETLGVRARSARWVGSSAIQSCSVRRRGAGSPACRRRRLLRPRQRAGYLAGSSDSCCVWSLRNWRMPVDLLVHVARRSPALHAVVARLRRQRQRRPAAIAASTSSSAKNVRQPGAAWAAPSRAGAGGRSAPRAPAPGPARTTCAACAGSRASTLRGSRSSRLGGGGVLAVEARPRAPPPSRARRAVARSAGSRSRQSRMASSSSGGTSGRNWLIGSTTSCCCFSASSVSELYSCGSRPVRNW